jgi:hypothetical protein
MPNTVELLKRLNMSADDFNGYMAAYANFLNLLNAQQLAFHMKNNRKLAAQVARSLGPDVSVDDIKALFAAAPADASGMMPVSCCD